MKLCAKTITPTALSATAHAGSSSKDVGADTRAAASIQVGIEQVDRFISAMSRNARPL